MNVQLPNILIASKFNNSQAMSINQHWNHIEISMKDIHQASVQHHLKWVNDHQISWMSLFGGTDTRVDLRCTGLVRISAFPQGSTGESVDSWRETGMLEGRLFSVSRSTVASSRDWLVLRVVESSAKSFLKWDELWVTLRSALSAVSMLFLSYSQRGWVIWCWQLFSLWLPD